MPVLVPPVAPVAAPVVVVSVVDVVDVVGVVDAAPRLTLAGDTRSGEDFGGTS